jgi:flagellar hook-associated protein 1 FlgK
MSLLNILGNGYSGLQAAQQALNVIGQNIANANTEGYARQRVDLAALQTTPDPGLYTGHGTQYNGVKVVGVERIKNAFLASAAANANGRLSALQSQVDPLNYVQGLLNEPTDNGLASSLDKFYGDWTLLGNNPNSQASGEVTIQDGISVAKQLNNLSGGVAAEWSNQRDNLTSIVQQANDQAASLADLNAQIKQGQVGGENVNTLMDERDKTVAALTSLVGGSASQGEDGQISVSISGVALVSGSTFKDPLTLSGSGDISASLTQPITLAIGTVTATPPSGQAAGILAALRTDLPGLSAAMDDIANSLASAVNGIHDAGYTLTGAAGGDFFTGTGAGGIAVAINSYTDLAVSSTAGAVDGSNAQKIGELANDQSAAAALGGQPGPSVLYRAMTSSLGTQISGLNTAITSQTAIVTTTQNEVDSDSGVSMDEELTNMILYQRSYQASAKVITTADQMLQTLIGMVS